MVDRLPQGYQLCIRFDFQRGRCEFFGLGFELGELRWESGKLATRGAFDGIPLTALMRTAGVRSPLASTLVIAGDWSVAATPLLNGVVHVRRERGDLFGTESLTATPDGLALGITALEAEARFQDDNVAATAKLRFSTPARRAISCG